MVNRHNRPTRLVVVGDDDQGRSNILSDRLVEARTDRPKGSFVEEIWRQDKLPVSPGVDGTDIDEITKLPPPDGFSVRKFSMPGNTPKQSPDRDALLAEFGTGNVSSLEEGAPALHRHPALHIFTILSGSMYFVLRGGDVLLQEGDSMILPGSMHDWFNPSDQDCIVLSTIACLPHP